MQRRRVGEKAEVTASSLNLRSGPGTSYAVIASMPKGTIVDVLSESSGFYRVTWGSYTGYCSGDYPVPYSAAGGRRRFTGGIRCRLFLLVGRRLLETRIVRQGEAAPDRAPAVRTVAVMAPTARDTSPRCGRFRGQARCRRAAIRIRRTTLQTKRASGGRWRADQRSKAMRLFINENGAGHIFMMDNGDPWAG